VESIIRFGEKILGSFVFYGFVIYAVVSIILRFDYSNVNSLSYWIAIFAYIVLWIYYIEMYVQEVLLYKRINVESVIELYSPRKKVLIINTFITLTIHVLYWVAVLNSKFAYLGLVYLALFFVPTIINKSIFETDRYIICSGIKYFYEDIEEYKEEFAYNIELKINGKYINMGCGNAKKYDIACERLKYRMIKLQAVSTNYVT